MDLRKHKTLIDLVSESGVAELEITEGEDHVRIVNRPTVSAAPVVQAPAAVTVAAVPQAAPAALIPAYGNTWEIGVLYGPHGAPDFFRPEAIEAFFAAHDPAGDRRGGRDDGPAQESLFARRDLPHV